MMSDPTTLRDIYQQALQAREERSRARTQAIRDCPLSELPALLRAFREEDRRDLEGRP